MVTKQKSRKRESATSLKLETGGDTNQQPRSLGNVFRAIRTRAGKRQAQMLQVLESQPSKYRMRKYKAAQQTVDEWESPTGNPPFAVLHRYAYSADTFAAVLHLTSLFYAHFRDAGLATSPEQADKNLAIITAAADGVIAVAHRAKDSAAAFRHTRDNYAFNVNAEAEPKDENLNKLRDAFINHLLDAYRHCPVVTATDFTFDAGHLPVCDRIDDSG